MKEKKGPDRCKGGRGEDGDGDKTEELKLPLRAGGRTRTRRERLRNPTDLDAIVVERDSEPSEDQGKRITPQPPVSQCDPYGQDCNQRKEADSLVPAERARGQLHHLTKEEAPERPRQRHDPSRIGELKIRISKPRVITSCLRHKNLGPS